MTETVTPTAPDAATEKPPTLFRVFKYDDGDDRWRESNLLVASKYSSFMTAEDLGRAGGPGYYMYFEAESRFPTVRFMLVVSEIRYREAEGEET